MEAAFPSIGFNASRKTRASPLPASTQWDVVKNTSNRIRPVYTQLIHQAAQGQIIYNDDTTMKILTLIKDTETIKGVFSTGILFCINVCEQALKLTLQHRKKSLFFKTTNGAYAGDLFMSIIHTCRLNKVNPFDYLIALQRHSAEVLENPREWMPCNYQSIPSPVPP